MINKGDVWLATQQGISKFNKDTRDFTNYTKANAPLKSENIRVMHQDARGNYWFGSEYALYRLDTNGVFHEYEHDFSCIPNLLMAKCIYLYNYDMQIEHF